MKNSTVDTTARHLLLLTMLLAMVLTASIGGIAFAGGVVPSPGWDGGSGKTWPGWTFSENVNGYEDRGWTRNGGTLLGGTIYPRSFEKTDQGSSQEANIVTTNLPPFKTTGAVLSISWLRGIFDPGWWIDYPYPNYGRLGVTDNASNRMSFWMYHEGADDEINTTTRMIYPILDMGTYLCWPGGGLGGEDCYTEANGQHYYHRLTGHSGAWIHYQMNEHPDHKRGQTGQEHPANDPAFVTNSKHYFYNFYKWYFARSVEPNSVATGYSLDNVYFYNAGTEENEYIGAYWVGYWPGSRYWEIGVSDLSFSPNTATSVSTYDVRWSTSPITNNNFNSANTITPQFFSYGTTKIRNPNPYLPYLWTRFTLPAGTETNSNKIFFAVRDVSATANGDGRNALTTNIRTIDYILRPQGAIPTRYPGAPTLMRID